MTDEGSEDAATLRPGLDIRPQLTQDAVAQMVYCLYGLEDVYITDFNGYDDKNYHIKINGEHKKEGVWEHGYVMKVMNTLDSKKLRFVEAQNDLMIYLDSHGITCPQPVKNLQGKYYSVEKIFKQGKTGPFKEHVVRLLTFQPGQLLFSIPCTGTLFFQAGRYIASLDQVLKGFYHSAYDNYKSMWMLESVPLLKNFTFVIKDTQQHDLAKQIIHTFEDTVLPKLDSLEKGIIHGDFNEQNIVVQPSSVENEWCIHAVLDFGDSQVSCYVFELAITICYMMLQDKLVHSLDAGGHVIAGYITKRSLPDVEFQMLKVCVCSRLIQSLVLGAYSHLQDPGNQYILTTQATGWKLLEKLWNTPEHSLYERWKVIMTSYSTAQEHTCNNVVASTKY